MPRLPNVRTPSTDELEEIARDLGFSMTQEDIASFAGIAGGVIASYNQLDEMVAPKLPVKYPRTTGTQPRAEDNPLAAWAWQCEVKGAKSGPLAGKTIALKDNIALAGVPMANGTNVLEGYVPDIDATLVTRILDAGGTITGKTANTYLCFDGASHTTASGMVENPRKKGHSAGGSSAGSGALVANGEVDMAIGGDQGGSIRIPACWCGIYGLKPTYGLVPYTGVFPIEQTIDHTGPMARNVSDVATLLGVIAGEDGYDPRQRKVVTHDYQKSLSGGVKGLRIGVLAEGFGHANSEDIVDMTVRSAVEKLESLGAKVDKVSMPMHLSGPAIWSGIATEGAATQMMHGNAYGYNWPGYYDTSLIDVWGNAWRARPDDLSETVKLVMLVGAYMTRKYNGRYYGKAQNMRYRLVQAYDDALAKYDVLVMPTLPMRASKLPAPDCSREENISVALDMLANTCTTNVTGHPAMSVPCGASDGLPIGMMIVGKKFDEPTVLRVAHACEEQGFYKT